MSCVSAHVSACPNHQTLRVTPLESLLICFELFGFEGTPFFLLAIGFSYTVSGYYSLYSSQKIVYSKYKSNFIDKSAK